MKPLEERVNTKGGFYSERAGEFVTDEPNYFPELLEFRIFFILNGSNH